MHIVLQEMKRHCAAGVGAAVGAGLVEGVAVMEGHAAAGDGRGGHGIFGGDGSGHLEIERFGLGRGIAAKAKNKKTVGREAQRAPVEADRGAGA